MCIVPLPGGLRTYLQRGPPGAGENQYRSYGAYFENCNPVTVSIDHHMFDVAMATTLWGVAEEMTADYLV